MVNKIACKDNHFKHLRKKVGLTQIKVAELLGIEHSAVSKRLILAQKKLLGENIQFINLDNINDITKNSRALFGFITFDTYKECFKVCFSAKEADNLYPVINQYFADFKKKAAVTPQASAADEIIKLKQLVDEGIITQSDFDAKKRQLLGI